MNKTNFHTQNAAFIIERLKELTDMKRDSHIAVLLDIAPTTLSTWKKRNSIDYRLIIDFCNNRGFDLNYVLLGKETEQENSQVENLAHVLIDKVKAQFQKDFDDIKEYKNYLAENLDKLKVKEGIEKAKEKVQKNTKRL